MGDSAETTKRAVLTSDNRLTLNGEWEVRGASSLHTELVGLRAEIQGDLPSAIDCRQIEKVDLAGIQLVLASKKSMAADIPIELDAETSSGFWFGLCGVGEPNFEYAS